MPAITQLCIIAFRKGENEIVASCRFCRPLHILVVNLAVHGDIVIDAFCKNVRVLKNKGDGVHQGFRGIFPDVPTCDSD